MTPFQIEPEEGIPAEALEGVLSPEQIAELSGEPAAVEEPAAPLEPEAPVEEPGQLDPGDLAARAQAFLEAQGYVVQPRGQEPGQESPAAPETPQPGSPLEGIPDVQVPPNFDQMDYVDQLRFVSAQLISQMLPGLVDAHVAPIAGKVQEWDAQVQQVTAVQSFDRIATDLAEEFNAPEIADSVRAKFQGMLAQYGPALLDTYNSDENFRNLIRDQAELQAIKATNGRLQTREQPLPTSDPVAPNVGGQKTGMPDDVIAGLDKALKAQGINSIDVSNMFGGGN